MEIIVLFLIFALSVFTVYMVGSLRVFLTKKGEAQSEAKALFILVTVAYAFTYCVYGTFNYHLDKTLSLFFTVMLYLSLFVGTILLFIKVEKEEEKEVPTTEQLLRDIKHRLTNKKGKTDKYFRHVLKELDEESVEDYIDLYARYEKVKKEEKHIQEILYSMKKKPVR